MIPRLLVLALFLLPLACRAETLSELLAKSNLPSAGFRPQELAQTVQGEADRNNGYTVVAYHQIKGELLIGPLHLIRFGQGRRNVVRFDVPDDNNDACAGSLNGVSYLRDLTLVELHINPSASCLLILDSTFRILRKLFGFDFHEVAPYQVTIIENMIHFAPVHPERLLLADLRHPGATELYPLKDDALRQAFIAEHKKRIPPQETCARMNDPCDPEDFDEDIRSLATDGKGRFAFIASLSASHALAENVEPEQSASQSILYIYQENDKGWLYCEQQLDDSQMNTVQREMPLQLDAAKARCVPNLPVVPDRSTGEYSPFALN